MVYGEACLLEGNLDPVLAQKMVGPEGEEVSLRLPLLQQINHLHHPLLVSPATFSTFWQPADDDSITMQSPHSNRKP